jgi:hypothetical protein
MGLFNTGLRTTVYSAAGYTLLPPANGGPNFLRDWSTYQTLDHLVGPPVEFSRGSTATYVGSNGLIQSSATNAPRFDYDPVTLACKGLLIEESRTNLLTYSEQFDNAAWTKGGVTVSANTSTAPNGSMVADTISTVASGNSLYQDYSTTGTSTLTASIYIHNSSTATSIQFMLWWGNGAGYVAGNINPISSTLSVGQGGVTGASYTITPAGNGWYRYSISATGTPNNGSVRVQAYLNTAGSNAIVWGAQLEAGAFATSYIPTTSASVTRAADVAQITGSNFSGMYNQNAGTLFAVAERGVVPSGQFPDLIRVTDGTTSNQIELGYLTEGLTSFSVSTAGVSQAVFYPPSALRKRKLAGSYATNYSSMANNGVLVGPDTSVTTPSGLNKMVIGDNGLAGNYLNGTISQIAYYPSRLTDTQLQTLTS